MEDDNEGTEVHRFTRSTCKCDFCVDTHKSVRDWSSHEAQTHLQTRMKDVVRRIERRVEIQEKIKSEMKK